MGFNKQSNFKMGKYSYGEPQILVWSVTDKKVIVGNFTSIAKGCKIILNGEHNTDWITTFPFRKFRNQWPQAAQIKGHPKTKGNVIIGSDVWIGRDVMIMSGIKIGDGAVVGARSLVSKDVDPYTIVGGNPAKVIKKRFTDKQIEKLLKIKWWDWPDNKVIDNIGLMSSNKIDEFIEKYGDKR